MKTMLKKILFILLFFSAAVPSVMQAALARKRKLNDEFMLAVKKNNIVKVRQALEKGADVNTQDKDGNTALMKAVSGVSLDLVELLLESEADPNWENNHGYSVLKEAVENGPLGSVKLLIKYKADIDRASGYDLRTALILSVMGDRLEITELLLKGGAGVNGQDKYGSTALMLAAMPGSLGRAKLLLKNGAGIMIKNKEGETALKIAQKWNKKVAKLFEGAVARKKDVDVAVLRDRKEAYPDISKLISEFDIEMEE